MERLGLGPDALPRRNPQLVYGRMTGWGQDGPLAPRAGHDINYIALTGVLNAIGREGDAPVPPLNLVGDFGGGGMLLAFGIACALLAGAALRQGPGGGRGDGGRRLAARGDVLRHSRRRALDEERGENVLDTGAPWYDAYETKDGKYVAIGSIEAKFYEELLLKRAWDPGLPPQHDREGWPALRKLSRGPSRRRRETSGARCSTARTPASRRC